MDKTNLKLMHKGGFMQENTYMCERCKEIFYDQSIEKWKYCPVCGRELEDNMTIE